jgi:hydrogenase maturation protease
MTHILIIGYGNPLRGDDGIGWHAAGLLQQHYAHDRRIEVLQCRQLAPELAADIASSDHVIFIDAVEAGPAGSIRHCTVCGEAHLTFTTHSCDPQALLASCLDLYGKCPTAALVAVTGESFAVQQQLTATLERALPLVVNRTEKMVNEYLAKADLDHTRHCAATGT